MKTAVKLVHLPNGWFWELHTNLLPKIDPFKAANAKEKRKLFKLIKTELPKEWRP